LAGPVVAGAVILRSTHLTVRIDDSKRLSACARETAFSAILSCADVGVGAVVSEEIDRLGIHRATALAMIRALKALGVSPKLALIDGPRIPLDCPVPAMPVVQGDARSLAIACASIVAKVTRDRWMGWVDALHPEYKFSRHKGYGTPEHLKVLKALGPSSYHRFSFHPIRS